MSFAWNQCLAFFCFSSWKPETGFQDLKHHSIGTCTSNCYRKWQQFLLLRSITSWLCWLCYVQVDKSFLKSLTRTAKKIHRTHYQCTSSDIMNIRIWSSKLGFAQYTWMQVVDIHVCFGQLQKLTGQGTKPHHANHHLTNGKTGFFSLARAYLENLGKSKKIT